ncbi:hypothetical protein F4811DRAFT_504809 [Daldinia bambusicola]|nr:hypothetical protein F4811DRAFT_504809 [Daldinia bambusicola]
MSTKTDTMSKPLIPRLHLWEIDDQPWFPSFLRAYVQAGLTHAWTVHIPLLQPSSPATIVAETLRRVLGPSASRHTYIDFCAGAGGPTPQIERALNGQLSRARARSSAGSGSGSATHRKEQQQQHQHHRRVPATARAGVVDGESRAAADTTPSYAAVADPGAKSTVVVSEDKGAKDDSDDDKSDENNEGEEEEESGQVDFVLTDLHPHVESWDAACKKSDRLSYVSRPVDAAHAPDDLIRRYTTEGSKKNGGGGGGGKGIFRLFNLAFHHFDDDLARAILKNTVETSDGFG